MADPILSLLVVRARLLLADHLYGARNDHPDHIHLLITDMRGNAKVSVSFTSRREHQSESFNFEVRNLKGDHITDGAGLDAWSQYLDSNKWLVAPTLLNS